MDQSLEREIRGLYSRYHSPRDRHGRAFVPLADAYRRAGDLLRARLLLEEGLRCHPDFASAHVVAARIARDVSDREAALEAARRALELDPGNVEVRRTLGGTAPGRASLGSPAPSVSVDGDGSSAEKAGRTGTAAPAPSEPSGDGNEVFGDEGEAAIPDDAIPEESWMVRDADVWRAGTDSGLASVDPVALEEEDERARALARAPGGAEEESAIGETPEDHAAGETPEVVTPPQPQVAPRQADAPKQAVAPARKVAPKQEAAPERRAAPTPSAPTGTVGETASTGIYTRTMGRLYEQQGLHTHAIAVYERVLESDPGDATLAGRLERLRLRATEEASTRASAARAARVGRDSERVGTRLPGSGLPVVPIESLAPDPPAADAHGRAP